MVQTEISQLATECKEWRQILRNYRDEFQNFKKSLPDICKKGLSKEQFVSVEHFDNQFHIQLINIHDLKQSIKTHERNIEREADNISEDRYRMHEELLAEFLSLESSLQELRNDFSRFVSATSC